MGSAGTIYMEFAVHSATKTAYVELEVLSSTRAISPPTDTAVLSYTSSGTPTYEGEEDLFYDSRTSAFDLEVRKD